jgi:hypothetical protein
MGTDVAGEAGMGKESSPVPDFVGGLQVPVLVTLAASEAGRLKIQSHYLKGAYCTAISPSSLSSGEGVAYVNWPVSKS